MERRKTKRDSNRTHSQYKKIAKGSNPLLKLDIFARPVSLTYSGVYKFKTSIGAIFSIICVLMSLGYAVFRSFPLYDNTNTSSTMNTLPVSDSNEFFSEGTQGAAYQNGRLIKPNVKFAVGIEGEILDKKYGEFVVTELQDGQATNVTHPLVNCKDKGVYQLEKDEISALKSVNIKDDVLQCLQDYKSYSLLNRKTSHIKLGEEKKTRQLQIKLKVC